MVTPPKWGQHVVVDPRAIRSDVKRAIGANLSGRIVSVIPSDPSLAGCVLVSFAGADMAQWVRAEDLRDDSA